MGEIAAGIATDTPQRIWVAAPVHATKYGIATSGNTRKTPACVGSWNQSLGRTRRALQWARNHVFHLKTLQQKMLPQTLEVSGQCDRLTAPHALVNDLAEVVCQPHVSYYP